MPAIVLINGWVNYEYINSTITGWVTPQNNYWIGAPWYNPPLPVILALHLVNQSVPEPWWYYESQFNITVPSSWFTLNDPFVYPTSTSTTSTTTSTSTSTSTSTVTTTTSTVTSTVTSSSSNTTLYVIIAVVVIIIVIIGVVLGLRRR
ncbi:hypothetical protein J5U21_00565 [Saccharolobus shibatae]|uniref:Uncharacterized protein n=1 Tax=Saccharolobus shibatae TaxID=2286 RepID=A0A8F5GVG5_9CREN|nr:hypothetical protein J5U21_00565 [Saccharolobus shibatae]